MASASPSASRTCFSFSASAARMTVCFSASADRICACLLPSAMVMAACFSPSARSTASRFSRSAFICFSMACWMAAGGVMFFTSTRFTLMPQASVASSRMERICALMVSREVSVVSRSRSPIMLRSVVAVRFSMAARGISTP